MALMTGRRACERSVETSSTAANPHHVSKDCAASSKKFAQLHEHRVEEGEKRLPVCAGVGQSVRLSWRVARPRHFIPSSCSLVPRFPILDAVRREHALSRFVGRSPLHAFLEHGGRQPRRTSLAGRG